MTPSALAKKLVDALAPTGRLLEPCAGNGAFVRELQRYGQVDICEISGGGFGFSWWTDHVDWIVTNPPWSQFRFFLEHSMEIADHVALLATVNHWWTKRRVADVKQAKFGYRRLLLCEWPPEFPSSGFQLGMMYIQRGYVGPLSVEWV
jgi:hypothetical protein